MLLSHDKFLRQLERAISQSDLPLSEAVLRHMTWMARLHAFALEPNQYTASTLLYSFLSTAYIGDTGRLLYIVQESNDRMDNFR